MMSHRERKLVVAALIQDDQGRVLLTQRRENQPHPLLWELPGGKIESGEAPQDALEREIAEELGAEIRVGPIWEVVFHAYPTFDVYMLVYRCELLSGAVAREVRALSWVDLGVLRNYDILPADEPIIARLMQSHQTPSS